MQDIVLLLLRRVRGSCRGSKKTLEINPDSPIIQVGPRSLCMCVLSSWAQRRCAKYGPYCC